MKKIRMSELHVSNGGARGLDLICLSHLRWNFVYQRPQHIMSRAAKFQRVFFFEEPMFHEKDPCLEVTTVAEGPFVIVPYLPYGLSESQQIEALRNLLDKMICDFEIEDYLSWYLTPMSLKFSRHLSPSLCIYDCMDQLSNFKDASREIPLLERELMRCADVVFTGGASLFEAKRHLHHNIHVFPSSVDVLHFSKARKLKKAMSCGDEALMPGPKIGYLGVLDERLDIELINQVSRLRPDWQLVMVGPVVKIDPESLPKAANIHYLGAKSYAELPNFLGSWDIAMLPFARNDATRFISPTKTPEYLSAGKRVISTPIRDVVKPYGEMNMVAIAHNAEDFVAHAEQLLIPDEGAYGDWLQRVDKFLALQSWDQTFHDMWAMINKTLAWKHTSPYCPILSEAPGFLIADKEGVGGAAVGSSRLRGSVAVAAAAVPGL